MPYIPRSMAPTSMPDPSTVPRAPARTTQERPPVPYMGSSTNEPNPAARKQTKQRMIDILNMENWDVDPLKVYKQLTGKELAVDESGNMVSNTGRSTR